MLETELKKNICSVSTVISIFLLYSIFLLGNSGEIFPGRSMTIIQAIIMKLNGKWYSSIDSLAVLRILHIWNDNEYLPIVTPMILGIPFTSNYLEELVTHNKSFILVRTNLRDYYYMKILTQTITSVLISGGALTFYTITLIIFYDPLTEGNEWFDIVCQLISRSNPTIQGIWFSIVKSDLYFILYAVLCGSFCFMVTILVRDQYLTLGTTIFLSYLQCRFITEWTRKYIEEGNILFGTLSDIFSPIFLCYAGKYGFYSDKESLAVIVAIVLIGLFYIIPYIYYQSNLDIADC